MSGKFKDPLEFSKKRTRLKLEPRVDVLFLSQVHFAEPVRFGGAYAEISDTIDIKFRGTIFGSNLESRAKACFGLLELLAMEMMQRFRKGFTP